MWRAACNPSRVFDTDMDFDHKVSMFACYGARQVINVLPIYYITATFSKSARSPAWDSTVTTLSIDTTLLASKLLLLPPTGTGIDGSC